MPAPPSSAVVLLRLAGEVSTKARPTRRAFVAQLVRNVKDALASEGITDRVERRHDRVLVESADARVPALLARVFGVQSASRAERHAVASLEDVVAAGDAAFREAVRGRRFAVRARSVGENNLPFRGRDVERALGERLRSVSAGVDLERPEFTARVELYDGAAYLFAEVETVKYAPFGDHRVHINEPSVLLYDTIDLGESKTGSLACVLGGKEGFENVRYYLSRNTAAGVSN